LKAVSAFAAHRASASEHSFKANARKGPKFLLTGRELTPVVRAISCALEHLKGELVAPIGDAQLAKKTVSSLHWPRWQRQRWQPHQQRRSNQGPMVSLPP
jgi:hypothetical protein